MNIYQLIILKMMIAIFTSNENFLDVISCLEIFLLHRKIKLFQKEIKPKYYMKKILLKQSNEQSDKQ